MRNEIKQPDDLVRATRAQAHQRGELIKNEHDRDSAQKAGHHGMRHEAD
jgi:hypothetical protein